MNELTATDIVSDAPGCGHDLNPNPNAYGQAVRMQRAIEYAQLETAGDALHMQELMAGGSQSGPAFVIIPLHSRHYSLSDPWPSPNSSPSLEPAPDSNMGCAARVGETSRSSGRNPLSVGS